MKRAKRFPLGALLLFYVILNLHVFSLAFLVPRTFALSEGVFSPSSFATITEGFAAQYYAYTSNNFYTQASDGNDGAETEYYNYGINFNVNHTISQVYVGVESYSTYPESENLTVKIFDGYDWHTQTCIDSDTEALVWYNFTNLGPMHEAWTYSMANSIKTRILFNTNRSGACFSPDTYFISWNQTAFEREKIPYLIKRIDKAVPGDLALTYSLAQGIHFTPITEIRVHEGEFTMYDIFSGVVSIAKDTVPLYEWLHHIQLTGNHPLSVYRKGEWVRTVASDVQLTDFTPHVHREERELLSNEWIPLNEHSVSLEPIARIDVYEFKGLTYDIQFFDSENRIFCTSITPEELAFLTELSSKHDINLGAYIDPLKEIKTTYYVDWLPVKVVYEGDVCIPCLFIGLVTFGLLCAVACYLLLRKNA